MMLFSALGVVAVIAWIYLSVAHGLFWMPLLPQKAELPAHLPSVDIVVPARNEAATLPQTLPGLLAQDYPGSWRVILVDDHSQDNTGEVARKIASDVGRDEKLIVLPAPALPEGWSGKVAAMNAGVNFGTAEMVLFTDSDILHSSDSLANLVARTESAGIDLSSRMVKLRCQSFAEKLLIPAFVFFFAMLYPFRHANDPRSGVAAAAGGVMLVRRSVLNRIGGLSSIRSALIDDCSLARVIKDAGGKTELTLTQEILSLRAYPHVQDVWQMVARTAYTQLRYSPILLAGTIVGMTILYLVPVLLFYFAPTTIALATGWLAFVLSAAIYMPMVKFYGLPVGWAFTLPVAALIYATATLDSARLYIQGKGGHWKGRSQAHG